MSVVIGDHLQFSTIALEVQGTLLAVANNYRRVPQSQPAHRGMITEFTRASRKRMLRKAARLDADKAVFMTLTYPARYPDPRTAKNHLRALLERFRRRYPDSSALWRLEAQERGAPHFHLLWFNLPFVPFWWLKHAWADIIRPFVDTILPFVRIELVESKRKVIRYVAKYCAKEGSGSLFNYGSYLHATLGPGRFWGVFNGPRLPFARRYMVRFSTIDPTGLRDILKVFTLAWEGVDPAWPHGVQVFSEQSYRLYQLALAAGLACKTHGTDILYETRPPAADRALHDTQAVWRHGTLRIRERKGILRPRPTTHNALGELLHDDLSL